MGYFRKKISCRLISREKILLWTFINTKIPFWKHNFFGYYVKNLPEDSLQTVLSWLHFKTGQALCRVENLVEVIEVNFPCWKLFFFHKKENWVFFWNFPFYLSCNSTLPISLREKNSLRSPREMVRVREEKSSCINYNLVPRSLIRELKILRRVRDSVRA